MVHVKKEVKRILTLLQGFMEQLGKKEMNRLTSIHKSPIIIQIIKAIKRSSINKNRKNIKKRNRKLLILIISQTKIHKTLIIFLTFIIINLHNNPKIITNPHHHHKPKIITITTSKTKNLPLSQSKKRSNRSTKISETNNFN